MAELCGRCGGSIVTERTIDGPEKKCIACGHGFPTTAPLVQPRGNAPGWVRDAATAFTEAVKRVEEAEAAAQKLRSEAERTRAALVAYGVPNVPELPWPTAQVKRATLASGRHREPKLDTCLHCGVQHTIYGTFFIHGTNGKRMCRDGSACQERRRAKALAPEAAD